MNPLRAFTLLASGALLPGAVFAAASPAFDEGGFSIDFAAASERRFAGGAKFTERSGFPISITNRPFGYIDNRFAVSAGQCGLVSFGWRRDGDLPCKVPTRDFRFEIGVPSGFRLLGTTFGDVASRREERAPGGSTVVRFRIRDGLEPSTWMNNQSPCNMLVAPMYWTRDRESATLTFRVVDPGGKPLSNLASVVLYVVPCVKARAVPKRFRNGFDASLHVYFREAAAYEALARLFGDIGARWLVQDIRNGDFIPHWRRHAGGPVTPMWDKVVENGFRVGRPEYLPESDRFVCDPASPRVARRKGRAKYLSDSTCPATVYRESEHFTAFTMAELKRLLAGADGLWGNWEPSMFYKNGCWCERCRDEFVAWSKLPAAEVRKEWPKLIQEGGRLERQGLKFHSWQHANVVRTIDRYVREATGGEKSCGFIPGVAAVEMSGYWLKTGYPEAMLQIDYSGDVKWMNPWGPYVRWEAEHPYARERRATLIYWVYAQDVRKTVAIDHPDGRIPKLLSYPQGGQCGTWVTEPEQIGLALDSFLLNGWDANCVYYFPNGYDARYLKAFAEANERAAVAEDFVLDGAPADNLVSLSPVAEYAVPVKTVTDWLPAYTNVSLLQSRAFDLHGSRLVAVLNFWDAGIAFADLKCTGLAAGEYSVVSGDTEWVKDADHPYWTAEELESGVRVAVGAVRSAFFVIRPRGVHVRKDLANLMMTRESVDALYGQRRSALKAAAERDAEDERRLPPPKKDWMGLN
jgi:hypothetical protein